MNKEFVPYELALELKQLGFDEPCIAYFARDTRGLCWHSNSVVPYNHNDIDKYGDLSAPTYSQAFRWFREKGYRYSICSCIDAGKNLYYIDGWFSEQFLFETDWIYQTYEEAELACLKKLIEIAK